MSKPANPPFSGEYPTTKSQGTFIAVIVLALLAVWGAAMFLVSVPLTFDEAVLLR